MDEIEVLRNNALSVMLKLCLVNSVRKFVYLGSVFAMGACDVCNEVEVEFHFVCERKMHVAIIMSVLP